MVVNRFKKRDKPDILVIDDSADSLKILTMSLTKAGYHVRPANSGELALASLGQKIPSLILLDVKMPVLDGYELCRRIKGHDAYQHIPVLFISALNGAIDKVKAFDIGAVDYITKPFQMEEVLARVKTQLILQQTRNRLEHARSALEERVRQRTKALEVANRALEKEIDERRQAQQQLRFDITSRKKAELALIESEYRFRSIFEQAAVGIVHTDHTGRFLRINDRFCEIVGYPKGELLGLSWRDITHMDDLQDGVEELKTLPDGKINTFKIQKRYIRKDNSVAWANVTVSSGRRPAETPKYAIAVIEDITDHKKMEAQLLQAHKMEAVGTLAGGIAHDFNNVLSSILGFAELGLDDVASGSELEDNLKEIYIAGKRARDLIKQIMTYARQSRQEVGPVSVSDICVECVKMLRATIPTTIEIQTCFENCNALILADASMIHQVVMNLCTNAYQAMEKTGGILTIDLDEICLDADSVKVHADLKPGKYLKLSVSNTGVGISSEVFDFIFDPYFSTKKPGKGTGMGLAVVHGIVKDFGGAITVESQPEEGSCFSVYFPTSEKWYDLPVTSKPELPCGNERILFVDDEKAIVKMQKRLLRRLGYGVEALTNPLEALTLFRSKPDHFDLVITDMTMLHMTGDILASEIIRIRPDIPVILCTGYSSVIREEEAVSLGIKGFVHKPIIKKQLAKTVRDVLDGQCALN